MTRWWLLPAYARTRGRLSIPILELVSIQSFELLCVREIPTFLVQLISVHQASSRPPSSIYRALHAFSCLLPPSSSSHRLLSSERVLAIFCLNRASWFQSHGITSPRHRVYAFSLVLTFVDPQLLL